MREVEREMGLSQSNKHIKYAKPIPAAKDANVAIWNHLHPVKSSPQRDFEVARLARQRAEQFFRAPQGFLRSIKFDGSEEDKELFMTRLSVARLATWGNDKEIAYEWYDMVKKIAEKDCDID